MTKAKAEKIRKGIEDKIGKTTVDMEWWAYFRGFTVDEYEEFLDMAIQALEEKYPCGLCKYCGDDGFAMCMYCPAEPRMESDTE